MSSVIKDTASVTYENLAVLVFEIMLTPMLPKKKKRTSDNMSAGLSRVYGCVAARDLTSVAESMCM